MKAFEWMLVVLAALPGAAQEKPAAIEGTVFNEITGEPVRKAEVRCSRANARGTQPRQGPMMVEPDYASSGVLSDAEGRFRFENLAPGTYSIDVVKHGFLRDRRWVRRDSLTLTQGQRLSGVRVPMIPQGVISGRVKDEDGDPMQGANVSALRPTWQNGQRRWSLAGSETTDDRGEFRISNLGSGKYLVMAMPGRMSVSAGPIAPSQGAGEVGYTSVYYPGVAQPDQATPLALQAGGEASGLEFTLKREPVFRVRGRVEGLPETTGRMAPFLLLVPEGGQTGERSVPAMFGPTGVFEAKGLRPGVYTAVVQTAGREGLRGTARVAVGDHDVEGITVAVAPGSSIPGNVRLEKTTGAKPDLSTLQLAINPADPIPLMPHNSRLTAAGDFSLDNVHPGRYVLRITGSPMDGLYLASARLGDQELTSDILDVSPGSPGALQLTLRGDMGSVSGTVEKSREFDAAPGWTAVLVPADAKTRRFGGPQRANVDANGSFQFTKLPPGEYLLFATEIVKAEDLEDPDFCKAYEKDAARVTVPASGTASAQLVPIPARDPVH